jgi:glycerophosphoryl diester phosphodiesterase
LLEETLRAFPDRLFNIDVKQPGIEWAVAGEVGRLGAEDRVLIASFSDRRIRRFRRLTGGRVATSAGPQEVASALAAARLGRPAPGAAVAYQVPERVGRLRVVGSRLVMAAHEAGKQVHVWTVNDPTDMRRLLSLGVDGIVTDRPDLLNEVLDGGGDGL